MSSEPFKEEGPFEEHLKAKTNPDPVNHPTHYTSGSVECIAAIEAALTREEFRGFCKGNALKYIWRERLKGQTQDVQKARFYLRRLEETK
jgi:hypothetical protein